MPFLFSGIGVVLMLALRRQGSVHLSVCAECAQRKRNALRAQWICLGIILVGFLPALLLKSMEGALATFAIVMFAALASLIVSFAMVRPAQFAIVERIDKTSLWLRGIHPSVAARVLSGPR